MKNFMDKDFLLESDTAKILFENHASKMPIFDFHNHLSVKEIYEDKILDSITYAWLGFDHYKWRAERSNGIDEYFITGNASDYEKFEKWAETVPYLFANPLYHWTHLELQRFFDINEPLNPQNCKKIYDICNRKIKSKEFSVRNLIKKSNIYALMTTDDPCDDLKYHKALKDEGFEVKVLPTFRPDNALKISNYTFLPYLDKLSDVVGYKISSFSLMKKALLERVDYFHEAGARISDHGLDEILYMDSDENELEMIFNRALNKQILTKDDKRKYQGALLNILGKKYSKLKWTMQIHIGALRNNSTRQFNNLGPDSGFDSINDKLIAEDLSNLLDSMDKTNELPKTILYCLNPRDNEVLATMLGNFQTGSIPSKIQFGPGWWFNDTKYGMLEHMKSLSSLGLLSRFVGMLTDSRSFLSFTRHEYFRRILCNYVGQLVENGEYPNDIDFLGKMIEDICFNNILNYSGIEKN